MGVGRMGAPMARRLLAAGHAVGVCDPASAEIDGLCGQGASRAEDPATAAAAAEVTITSLPTPAVIESVVLWSGACSRARRGAGS